MALSWQEYVTQRKPFETQWLPAEGGERRPTVLLCSHIWWTEQLAYALHRMGYNVLLHYPFYLMYTDPAAAGHFEALWEGVLGTIKRYGVKVILAGNSAGMAVHMKTGEMLHEAAGVRLVNWWWDELRAKPALANWSAVGGEAEAVSPERYLKMIGGRDVVNAMWDRDVMEELEAEFGWGNMLHMPLGTLSEYWPHGWLEMKDRSIVACFVGNCHFDAGWAEQGSEEVNVWARAVVEAKMAQPEVSMAAHVAAVTGKLGEPNVKGSWGKDPYGERFGKWEVLNGTWMQFTRNRLVLAAARHLGGKFALVGKGWEKVGLRANAEHMGEKTGVIYMQSLMSLNLFGGCVHGGMPLRPFDICASGGLLMTHFQRELPELFDPGKECLVFKNEGEMVEVMDKVRREPEAYAGVAQAGRRRVLAEHTWERRVGKLMEKVG